jgi:hypothetical protein
MKFFERLVWGRLELAGWNWNDVHPSRLNTEACRSRRSRRAFRFAGVRHSEIMPPKVRRLAGW